MLIHIANMVLDFLPKINKIKIKIKNKKTFPQAPGAFN